MRKPHKSRPRSGGGSSPVSLQNLIVLLLVILIIINFYHLYLDHLTGKNKSAALQQRIAAAQPEKPATASEKPFRDTLKVSPGSMVAPSVQKPAPAPLLTADLPAPGEVQIQVLNGCGIPGVASRVRSVLRERGFDVLSFGNAQKQDYARTVVIARSELPFSERAARRVANSLGISADQVSVQTDLGLGDVDVTLILGSDYQKLNLKTE